MILHHFTSVFLSSTFVMASNNNNLLPNRSTYPTLPPYYSTQTQFPPVSYPIQRQFQPVSYPIQIQQPILQQIRTIYNQYQKKRDASHLSVKQPSKRRKLNHAFNQHDITDYKHYLRCILRIIQSTIQYHNHVKKDYERKESGGGLLNMKNLRKYAEMMERAYACDPKLHHAVVCHAIEKVLHHIPVSYQEKIATQSG
eukprot:436149_1